jgi:hypothetical protein
MESSDNVPQDAPADDVSIPEQTYAGPQYVEFPTSAPVVDNVARAATLDDVIARLDRVATHIEQLEGASNASFTVLGKMAAQVEWIGGTLNGILNSAAQMGGPGGKIMSMMLGGKKS